MATPTETILGIDRALIIMKYLADLKEEVGLRKLARDLGYSPAMTEKILNSLIRHGFVWQNTETGTYRLGLGLVKLGLAALSRLDLVQLAHPYLEELTEATQETTFLAVLNGVSAVYIDKVTSPLPVRMDAEIGVDRPLNCTAVGKILLSYSPPGTLAKVAELGGFQRFTANSVMDPTILEQELVGIRKSGIAFDRQEFNSDAICVAAPIFAYDGKVAAAVTTSGPSFRMQENLDLYTRLVKDVASRISAELGFRS